MMMYKIRQAEALLFFWLLLLSCSRIIRVVESRTTSGWFRLNGEKSEIVMTSFGIGGGHGMGDYKVHISTVEKYPNEANLKFHMYADTNWDKFLKATTCREKIQYAATTYNLNFEFKSVAGYSKKWVATLPEIRFKQDELIKDYDNNVADGGRPHYWYFVVDDCSLEEYFQDNAIPEMEYWIKVRNLNNEKRPSHFSWGERIYPKEIDTTLIVTGSLGCFMMWNIYQSIRSKGSVHLIKFLVLFATGINFVSSLAEVLHLRQYSRDGIGNYVFDAIAVYLEAICDGILTILLLTLASGWTMPSDVITTQQTNATFLQSVVARLSSPSSSSGKSSSSGSSLFGIVFISIIVVHLILAQWGRVYNDNFDSYHDLDHLPGKILMIMRVLLGIFMIAAITQTKSKCTMKSLHSFYNLLMAVGSLWFQSLPLITFICNRSWIVHYYMRMPLIKICCTALQLSFLALLTCLITFHSTFASYHKVSHITQSEESLNNEELIPELATTTTITSLSSVFKLGKTKIRLD